MKAPVVPPYVVSIISYLVFTSGVLWLLVAIYTWYRFHVHFPAIDAWHYVPLIRDVLENGLSSPDWEAWFGPHAGSHRIALARLLLALDYQYFGGQNHVIYTITWLCIAIVLLIFVAAFRESYRSENTLSLFVAGLCLLFLLSHTQALNLTLPINGTWHMVFAASSLSVYLVVRRSDPPSAPGFAMAYLFAIAAVLSNSAGLAVLLLLPCLIALRSVRAGLLAVLITVLMVSLYLSGLHIGSIGGGAPQVINEATNEGVLGQINSTLIAKMRWATGVLSNTLDCLGSPLSIHSPIFARILVSASFLLLIVGVIELLLKRRSNKRWHNVWFEMVLALAILGIVVAVLISASRAGWGPVGNRYQTLVMFYWLCICCVTLDFGIRHGKIDGLRRLASQVLCIVIAVLFLSDTSRSLRPASYINEAANKSAALAVLGVTKTDGARTILPRSSARDLTEFDQQSSRTNTSYWYDRAQHVDFEGAVKCAQIRLGIQPSEYPGISFVHATIDDAWSKAYREIPITTSEGDVIGILTPNYSTNVTPLSLVTGEDDLWAAYIPAGNYQDGEISEMVLHYRTSPFSRKPCLIKYKHKAK